MNLTLKSIKTSLFFLLFLSGTPLLFAQEDVVQKDNTEDNPALKEAQNFVAQGNEESLGNDFALAETAYRRAVAKDPANLSAKYNMGNNYYKNKKFAEGMSRYAQAIEVAKTKEEKHRAFHNLGNALYQQKDFKKAVEAYKNALRNDPTDEETRYNLALAKKEDDKKGGGGDDDKDKKDKDKKDENKDKKDDKGDDKKGDDGKPKDQDDKGDQKKDQGDDKEDKGKPDDKKGDQKKPEQGDGEQQPQQPQPGEGQLSPQQVKSLLEAMKNEENKVQDKMNAKKVKGAQVKTDKDW